MHFIDPIDPVEERNNENEKQKKETLMKWKITNKRHGKAEKIIRHGLGSIAFSE